MANSDWQSALITVDEPTETVIAEETSAWIRETIKGGFSESYAKIETLRFALSWLVDHYVDLAKSGDAGFWDPETEEVVITAREALKGTE